MTPPKDPQAQLDRILERHMHDCGYECKLAKDLLAWHQAYSKEAQRELVARISVALGVFVLGAKTKEEEQSFRQAIRVVNQTFEQGEELFNPTNGAKP